MVKNKVYIFLSVLILAVAIFFIAIRVNSFNQSKKIINGYDVKISEIYTKFKSDTEKSDKINDIEELSKNYEIYKNSNSKLNIDANFESKINIMKNYFIQKNDKIIADNTLNDLENIKDIGKILYSETNISNTIATISNETDTIYTKSQSSKRRAELDKLIKSYEVRINDINKITLGE